MKHTCKETIRRSSHIILSRYERVRSNYKFIDTKFDIVTGRDFDKYYPPFYRKKCVYSWIQGRGLESMAKHALFFEKEGDATTAYRIDRMLSEVAISMENCRVVNAGRLPFAMHEDGNTFFPEVPAIANYSDMFYAKGLFQAAKRLNNREFEIIASSLFMRVVKAISDDQFRTDQHEFDRKNPVIFVPGKYPLGPRMVALSGLHDFAESGNSDAPWLDIASEFIRFILDHHVNNGQYTDMRHLDFIEYICSDGNVWRDNNIVISDPGHALEFIGLAAKCLCIMQKCKIHEDLIERGGRILPDLYCHVFDYGFNRTSGGICKGFNLVSRIPSNSDMPWWCLPEAVRAGAILAALYPGTRGPEIFVRIGCAFQAFTQGFLQPSGFACQTRSAVGEILNVIPAVPDADPGYHTNLSFLDLISICAASCAKDISHI